MEYEIRPQKQNGAKHSALVARDGFAVSPPMINSAVASVGRSAALPGNGVSASNIAQVSTSRSAPTTEASAASLWGSCFRVAATAINAPSASSHARVKVEK